MSNLSQRKVDGLLAIVQGMNQSIDIANVDEETITVRSLRAIARGLGKQLTYDSSGQPVITDVTPTLPSSSGGSGSTTNFGGGDSSTTTVGGNTGGTGTGSTTTVGGGTESTTTIGGNGGTGSKVEIVGERIEFRDGQDRLITAIVNTSKFADLAPADGDEVIELDDTTGNLKYPEIKSWIYDAANTRWLSSDVVDVGVVSLEAANVNAYGPVHYIPHRPFAWLLESFNLEYRIAAPNIAYFRVYEMGLGNAVPPSTPFSYATTVNDANAVYNATPGTVLAANKFFYVDVNSNGAWSSMRMRFRKIRP